MPRRNEEGFTVAEMAVTVMIMGMVLVVLFGSLNTMMASERRQQAKISNQEQVRAVMAQMSRDLRAANPLLPADAVGDYVSRFDVALGPLDGTQTHVRWVLSGTTLKRQTISPAGTVLTSNDVLFNVTNGSTSDPLFRYYSDTATELQVSGLTPVTVGDVENCTIRVHIAIEARPERQAPAFREETDAELRNRLPGGTGC